MCVCVCLCVCVRMCFNFFLKSLLNSLCTCHNYLCYCSFCVFYFFLPAIGHRVLADRLASSSACVVGFPVVIPPIEIGGGGSILKLLHPSVHLSRYLIMST